MKKILALLLSILLPGGAGFSALAQQGTPQTAPPPAEISDAQKRHETFELVWKTVNDRFYDPAFGGLDWRKVHERYAPLVALAKTDQEFHPLLQQMLNELHQSHFMIIPKEAIPKLPKRKGDDTVDGVDTDDLAAAEEDDSATPLDRLGYKNTERLTTGIGIDLRVVQGSAIITRVEPTSAAARAGLRPGFVIKSVSGRSIDTAIAQYESNQTFQRVFRGELPLMLLAGFINGERRSPVQIGFVDGLNRPRSVRITREKLKGEMSPAIGNLPAMYSEFESRRLPGGFGYIRFNAFVPVEMRKVCAALRSMRDAPGLVIDLRGNQGGLLGMLGGLSGLLETNVAALGTMQTRTGRISLVSFPQRSPYSGPIVIIVDGSTQSAAEMFAGGMQETGRAVIVGEQSAGNTLPSAIIKLPTGALFQYGFANYQTPGGASLEGHGVTPDIKVSLTRRSLLIGSDPQLTSALRKIRELAYWMHPHRANGRRELIADVTVTAPAPSATGSRGAVEIGPAKADPSPPAPVIVTSQPAKLDEKKEPVLAGLPSANQVIDRYIEAIGGLAALAKLTNRVSIGTVELKSMGLGGTVEIYEQAPNKSSVIIGVDGLGTIQETFDGKIAWLQHPLEGYIRLPPEAVKLTKDAEFRQELRLKELSPTLILTGKEKFGEREAFVLQSISGMGNEKWYFDAENGLLLRHGDSYFEDYRQVDGVKLPFKVVDDTTYGFGIMVRLSEIKHNVSIDQSKFMEYPDCFTKPDQKK
jgi:carboxyl-terminal processing protease